jgi:hypothetical protein
MSSLPRAVIGLTTRVPVSPSFCVFLLFPTVGAKLPRVAGAPTFPALTPCAVSFSFPLTKELSPSCYMFFDTVQV